jgi:hypothetical protein
MKIHWHEVIPGILIAIVGILLSLCFFRIALDGFYSWIFILGGINMLGLFIVGILFALINIEFKTKSSL